MDGRKTVEEISVLEIEDRGRSIRFFRLSLLFFEVAFSYFTGEEPKKRKSKWDVSAPAVKTATPPAKGGLQGAGVACTSDSASAAKKPKI